MGKILTGPGAFRLILALAVFQHHVASIAVGSAAVYVFFVLSGFWICTMWRDRYSKANAPYFTYLVSRLWRLLPVFALIGTGFLLWRWVVGLPITGHMIASTFLILGYASLPQLPMAPAWSLDIELQFYILAPGLIWLMARGHARLTLVTAGLLGIAAASLHLKAFVPQHLFWFCVGMAASTIDWQPSGRLAWSGVALAAVTSLALLISPIRDVILGGANPTPLHRFNELYNVGLALCLAPYAIWSTRQKGGAWDGAFADLSYVVYLLHWATGNWLAAHAAHLATGPRIVVTAGAVVVTLGASWLIWRYFDKPINRQRAAWVRKRLDGV